MIVEMLGLTHVLGVRQGDDRMSPILIKIAIEEVLQKVAVISLGVKNGKSAKPS